MVHARGGGQHAWPQRFEVIFANGCLLLLTLG